MCLTETSAKTKSKNGVICIRKTIERIYILDGEKIHTEIIIGTPKTQNSIRDIPMNKELLKMLRPLKNRKWQVLCTY